MFFIDTHAHLFLEEFANDREKVIENALGNHVTKILLPNIDSLSIEPMLALCKKHPRHCFPAIGLHPTSVHENWQEELENIEQWLTKEKFYAIGETGMDLYWEISRIHLQEKAFRKQIELASKHNLPLSIHSRNAVHEILDVIDDMKDCSMKGVFHCFGGSPDQAAQIIKLGFKIGVGGVVTFKNSGLDKLISTLSLKDIILETDAPYLAPMPHRGKRNESGYVPLIAEKIAELKNCKVEEVAEITSKNAEVLFGI
jgi:TatD DNase family protein